MILEKIAVLIPALDPNDKLVDLVKQLNRIGIVNILIIDDSSVSLSQRVFNEVQTYQAAVGWSHYLCIS